MIWTRLWKSWSSTSCKKIIGLCWVSFLSLCVLFFPVCCETCRESPELWYLSSGICILPSTFLQNDGLLLWNCAELLTFNYTNFLKILIFSYSITIKISYERTRLSSCFILHSYTVFYLKYDCIAIIKLSS